MTFLSAILQLGLPTLIGLASLILTVFGIMVTINRINLRGYRRGVTVALFVWLGFVSVLIAYAGVLFDHRAYYTLVSHAYGVAKDDLSRQVYVDSNGSSKSLLRMGIRAVTQDVSRLEHEYRLPAHPDSDVYRLMTLRPNLIRCSGNHKLRILPAFAEGRTVAHSLLMEPKLQKGQIAYLEEPIEQCAPARSFFVSRAEMNETNEPYDYSATQLRYPTDHFTLEIIFWPGFRVTREDVDVWFGSERTRNKEEYEYLQRGRNEFFSSWNDGDGCTHLKLDLPYPRWGLTYAVVWEPAQ